MGRRRRWGRRHGPAGRSSGTDLFCLDIVYLDILLLLLRCLFAAPAPGQHFLPLDEKFLVVTLALNGCARADEIADNAPISESVHFEGLFEEHRLLLGPFTGCSLGWLYGTCTTTTRVRLRNIRALFGGNLFWWRLGAALG